MPEIILNCPQCERPLRVPENLIGQLVKCPACGLTFSVPAGAEPQPVPPAPSDAETPVPRHHSAHDPYASTEEEFERPRRRDRLSPWEEEHERAKSLIMPPAILLLLTGILGLLADVAQVVYAAIMTRFPPPAPAQPPQDFVEALRQGATGPVPIFLNILHTRGTAGICTTFSKHG